MWDVPFFIFMELMSLNGYQAVGVKEENIGDCRVYRRISPLAKIRDRRDDEFEERMKHQMT